MHAYRTHTCGALTLDDVGGEVRISGWVHRKRDHGHLLFVDLRDHYGITQCVVEQGEANFEAAEAIRPESVITVTGEVVARTEDTVNAEMATGTIEVVAATYLTESSCEQLPFPVNQDLKAAIHRAVAARAASQGGVTVIYEDAAEDDAPPQTAQAESP